MESSSELALISTEVQAIVYDLFVRVEKKQTFANLNNHYVEYVFSIENIPDSSIIDVRAETTTEEGKTKILYGVVREAEKAFNTYDDTLTKGHGSVLLESHSNQTRINFGGIPSFSVVTLHTTHLVPLQITSASTDTTTNNSSKRLKTCQEAPCLPQDNTLTFSKQDLLDGLTMTIYRSVVPSAVSEYDPIGKTTAMALLWQPKWEELLIEKTTNDIIFVVDQSASMSPYVSQIKRILHIFVSSLQGEVKFNVVGFGSEFHMLFKESKEYNEENLAVTRRYIESIEANMGGTNMLKPLSAILTNKAMNRKLVNITDGQIENESEVVDLIKKNQDTTVYSVGIGKDVSASLVNGIANAGRGQAEFINEQDDIEIKIYRQLKRALSDVVNNTRVQWPKNSSGYYRQVPIQPSVVVKGESNVFVALIEGQIEKDACVNVEATQNTEISEKFPISPHYNTNTLLHKYVATKIIHNLNTESKIHQNEAKNLALRYGLMSKYTSLVCVDKKPNTEDNYKNMLTLTVIKPGQYILPIPQSQYPDYNFIGLILGPRNLTKKRIERESGCEIEVKREASPYVIIDYDSPIQLDAALRILSDMLEPKLDSNTHKRTQLRELAEINGTLRGNVSPSSTFVKAPIMPSLGTVNSNNKAQSLLLRQTLDGLLLLQCMDGHWAMSEEFAKIVGIEIRSLLKLVENASRDVVATMLALYFFEIGRKEANGEIYELIINKAYVWVLSNVPDNVAKDVKRVVALLLNKI